MFDGLRLSEPWRNDHWTNVVKKWIRDEIAAHRLAPVLDLNHLIQARLLRQPYDATRQKPLRSPLATVGWKFLMSAQPTGAMSLQFTVAYRRSEVAPVVNWYRQHC